MEHKKDKRALGFLILSAGCALLAWLALVLAKSTGEMAMSWPVVLLGFLWIPAIVYAAAIAFVAMLILPVRVKRWSRLRKTTLKIREQAKALGIWDRPQALGGKALTMSAWENFGIKRKPGETDMDLRIRCSQKVAEKMAEIDAEVARRFKSKAQGEDLDRLALLYGIDRKPGESDEELRRRCVAAAQRAEIPGENKAERSGQHEI